MTLPSRPTGVSADPILVPGETCCAVEYADRFRLIVDGEGYFRALKRAMLKAERQILLIGWDFDVRVGFEAAGEKEVEGPNRLREFLRWIVRRRPGLEVYILQWDLGVLYTLGPGALATLMMRWRGDRRIHFRFDRHHPPGAAHHQKIAVIDDRLGFCGGIDFTDERWDTRAHKDEDPRRRHPSGGTYPSWHDATAAVDGDAARRLGEIGRARWLAATGKRLPRPDCTSDPWPGGLEPQLRDVRVALARTAPKMEDQEEVREIEALYLAGIRAAERVLYFESQYFAARRIAEAIAERLAEPDGPEVIVINPQDAMGWLEEVTMDSARAKLLGLVHRADRYGRFRFYYPQTRRGAPIYVHAKIMIVDGRLFRVGSSNLNNRSMGFDTECDLAIEARPGEARAEDLADFIHAVRDDLLAEHLHTDAAAVREARRAAGGSLVAALDALTAHGSGLKRFDPEDIGPVGELVAESDLVDPERPPHLLRRLARRLTGRARIA